MSKDSFLSDVLDSISVATGIPRYFYENNQSPEVRYTNELEVAILNLAAYPGVPCHIKIEEAKEAVSKYESLNVSLVSRGSRLLYRINGKLTLPQQTPSYTYVNNSKNYFWGFDSSEFDVDIYVDTENGHTYGGMYPKYNPIKDLIILEEILRDSVLSIFR